MERLPHSPPPRTIREQITDRLREQVVRGELAPGQALRETELAAQYGVSRGPVRDAFLKLADEGLLLYQPNRGVTVNSPPKPENRTLIASLRQQIECFVARQGIKTLSDEDLAELDAQLETICEACERNDASTLARADLAFHEALLVRCGGAEFLPIWKWLCSQMLMTYGRLDEYSEAFEEHSTILEAARTRRVSDITSALKANIQ